jgi:hypothetical protein
MKEVIDEVIAEIQEVDAQAKSELLKNVAFFGSSLFFIYFVFYLPGSTINPEDLVQYNWINQSLIDLKISFINFITNPSNPGNPGQGGTLGPISPTNSIMSESLTTVTPNSPVISNNNIPLQFNSVGTQTYIDGITVSKFQETVNILADVLPEDNSTMIKNEVNSVIKIITD